MNPRFLGPLLLALVCPCVASTITISTTSVPNGTVKTAYSAVINASKGCTPYKWTIASGSLPAGVTAKPSSTTTSLTLSGTPTTAATYSFAVKATGCGGSVSQVAYKVVIQAGSESRSGSLVEAFDHRGSRRLQRVSQSGLSQLEEAQPRPDWLDSIQRFDRG